MGLHPQDYFTKMKKESIWIKNGQIYILSYGTDTLSPISIIGLQNINFLFAFDTCGKLTKSKEDIVFTFFILAS